MIHYALICQNEHKFDGWFRNTEAFEEQRGRGVVTCPSCGSSDVEKAIMAPAVARATAKPVSLSSGHPQQAHLREALRLLRQKVISEADYVGNRFAEEARKIHFEEVDPRGIYGEATSEEVAGLLEDGIDFLPLPNVPDEQN